MKFKESRIKKKDKSKVESTKMKILLLEVKMKKIWQLFENL